MSCVKRQKKNCIGTAGCGSVWLERLVWDQEAAGSNPVTPTAVNNIYRFSDYAGVVQW